jgi:hypothetical protein
MGTCFLPTRQDVERYRSWRALSISVCERMTKIIPRQALYEIADALGILRNGILVFDSPDVTSVLANCYLFELPVAGRSPSKISDSGGAVHSGGRRRLLPGCLNGEELFLMDHGLSKSAADGKSLATRTIPLGEAPVCRSTTGKISWTACAGWKANALSRSKVLAGWGHRLRARVSPPELPTTSNYRVTEPRLPRHKPRRRR